MANDIFSGWNGYAWKDGEYIDDIQSFFDDSAWQPIETAPKNGSRILAFNGDTIEIVKWDTFFLKPSGWLISISGESGFNYIETLINATHWMPIPKAPVSK